MPVTSQAFLSKSKRAKKNGMSLCNGLTKNDRFCHTVTIIAAMVMIRCDVITS